MANFNRVILVGNLTRDVEIKYLQSGMAVTEIGLAMNHKYKSKSGELVEEPVFVDVTLWGRTAELAGEYLGKGSNVLIEGRLKYDTWEKDGQKHSKLRVVGENMQFLGAPRSAGGSVGGGGGGGNRSQRPTQQQASQQSPQQFNEAEYQRSPDDYGSPPEPRATAPAGAPPEDIPF